MYPWGKSMVFPDPFIPRFFGGAARDHGLLPGARLVGCEVGGLLNSRVSAGETFSGKVDRFCW